MKRMCEEAEKIMTERFGKDMVIALATAEKGVPYVRYVNAYYENGAFYVITYALSNKIKHLENNPVIAIAGEWFTAHGRGINLCYAYDNFLFQTAFRLWTENSGGTACCIFVQRGK